MTPKLKNILEYVPTAGDRTLVQVRLDSALRERVNAQREADGLSWQQLVEACFRRYLDEKKASR